MKEKNKPKQSEVILKHAKKLPFFRDGDDAFVMIDINGHGSDKKKTNISKFKMDRRLAKAVFDHLDSLGLTYSVKGLDEEKGIVSGRGMIVHINQLDRTVDVIPNHNRNRRIGIRDGVEFDDLLMVVSLSEFNNLGYVLEMKLSCNHDNL